MHWRRCGFIFSIIFSLCILGAGEIVAQGQINAPNATSGSATNLNPWGVATGSEWQSAFPLFNPLLEKAGVGWLRAFNEWQTIEPKQGYWNWAQSDRLVTDAKSHGLNLVWVLAYLAPWASADG